MSPDLKALRQLVHTESDTKLYDLLQAIYTTEAHTRSRSRAGGKLYTFLSNLPEFRAGNEKYRDLSEVESSDEDLDSPAQKPPKATKPKYTPVCSLADEANKSADIIENLWLWLFGDGKDGIPRIEKFAPKYPDKGLLLNMLIWLRAQRGYLKLQNKEDHYKQSQVLSSDAPKKIGGSEEIGSFLESIPATAPSLWNEFWESCYHDEDDFLKQSFNSAFPDYNCHLYLMLTRFRESPLKQKDVYKFLNQQHGWNITNNIVVGLWNDKFFPLLQQKYKDFLNNDGELITNSLDLDPIK
jgi:hypothetical protein